jgi:lipid II:glycine glycyltransferase (peptidoglycan interpeptide bridge formation enzyme)
MIYRDLQEGEKEQFDSLATHPLQTYEWGEFRSQTSSVASVVRIGNIEKKEGKVFQIFFHKIPGIKKTVAYIPRTLSPNKQELAQIITIAKENNAAFIKFEPIEPGLNTGIVSKSILPNHTFYIDIKKTESDLLSSMHEKARYNVRLAQRKGVVVEEETTKIGLRKFIDILTATEKRQGFYAHTPNYYELLFETLAPNGMFRILNAYSDKKVVGSLGLFVFKDFLYYPYGGFDYEKRSLMAPQLLHFEAMRLGKKLGLSTYDLWGSYKNAPNENDPWWGFYRLKAGLGGDEVHFPKTIDIPLNPIYPALILADKARWLALKIKSLI